MRYPIGSDFRGTVVAWTPTITSGTGTLTTVSVGASEAVRFSKWLFFYLDLTITTNGTGATDIRATMPLTCQFGLGSGRIVTTGVMIQAYINATTLLKIVKFDNSYPGASAYNLIVNGFAEI